MSRDHIDDIERLPSAEPTFDERTGGGDARPTGEEAMA